MGRRSTNNPRKIPLKSCGCPDATAKHRPGTKPTMKEADCVCSWQYRYKDPGGRDQHINRPTFEEAVAAGEEAKVAVRSGLWIDPKRSGIQLRQWWLLWKPNLGGSDGHKLREEAFWRNHIEPRFGRYPLTGFSWLEIQTWVNELGPKAGLDPSTVRNLHALLDRMLAAALYDRRIPFNPCDGIKLPAAKKVSKSEARPPTYAQMWLIRQQLPRYWWNLQIVMQETGLRFGEVTALRPWHVDLEYRTLSVSEVLERAGAELRRKAYPKSEAGQRTVPLTGLAVRALRDQFADRRPASTRTQPEDGMHPEELLFVGLTRTWKGRERLVPVAHKPFRMTWNRATAAAGVQRVTTKKLPGGKTRKTFWPTIHDQRGAFASRLHARGVPEAIVQEVLGHERAGSVTWLYTHASADHVGQLLVAMDDWKRRGGTRLRLVS